MQNRGSEFEGRDEHSGFRTSNDRRDTGSRIEQISSRELQRLEDDNMSLKMSLKKLQTEMSQFMAKKEADVAEFGAKSIQFAREAAEMKRTIEQLESKNKSLEDKIGVLQSALKNQIKAQAYSQQDLIEEINEVDDPLALVIINKLMFHGPFGQEADRQSRRIAGSNAEQSHRRTIRSEAEQAGRGELSGSKNLSKTRREYKELVKEVQTLKGQNEFLLTQLEFAEKQLDRRGGAAAGSTGARDLSFQREVCKLFRIRDESRAIDALRKIEQAYQLFPVMQDTLEQVYQIVTENRCIPAMCNSSSELLEILDNWVGNLQDYQQLVVQLFDLLNIREDSLKNRTHLISTIKELVFNSSAQGRDQVNLADEEKLKATTQTILDEFRKIKNPNDFFWEEAKKKLELPTSYSNEALFAKLLKVLDNPEAKSAFQVAGEAGVVH